MANFAALFDHRFKLPLHITELFLVVVVLILSVVQMLTRPKNAPSGRSNTMALGMAAKSLIIILYQFLSSHVNSFKKWASLKAYVILNALEIVFWAAVVFMVMQANTKFCEGISCTLSWVIFVLGIFMRFVEVKCLEILGRKQLRLTTGFQSYSCIASHMTAITWLDFKHFRNYGTPRVHHYESKHVGDQII
ncbi:hypothetical protein GMORB2_0361 [Geosmithia morbida]|uniref:Uncharacterized protein n=1 Tax=Geosmithia morbida TaxID=1094350 RepID=A0A9P4Z2Q7_9HYPO|nr:uncharacterized protein GMORB2_0361 [Geosmithia morbida]KAF4126625.1 hypothetical protein GMORB2_0361 [Geosmithia morbida]